MFTRSAVLHTRHTPAPPHGGIGRLAFVLLLLSSVVVQGFALQIHLHGLPLVSGQSHAEGLYAPHPNTGDDGVIDPANCSVCQSAHAFGSYLLPSTPILPGLFIGTGLVSVAAAALGPPCPAHPWYGRAPPFV